MKYKVVIESDVSKLEERINILISKGYVPIGGVCRYQSGGNLLQAMIKTI